MYLLQSLAETFFLMVAASIALPALFCMFKD
jgi:hypothetical protein